MQSFHLSAVYYHPGLAVGVGGVTLLVAAIARKGPGWWIVGVIILVLGFFF
jgi:hypothetical protein